MSKDAIRIGIVGAGNNTRQLHIPGFQAIEGVEVVSVANRTRESGQRVADQFGIPKVYDSWSALISAPDTDAICIGTWPYMHRTLVLAALEHGKHVLTEARMAMDAEEARSMLEASLWNPDLVCQVVPAPFTFKVDRTIMKLMDEGYLGEILSADLSAQKGFLDREAPFTWRHDRDLNGLNTLMMGPWYECVMRWLGHATSVTSVARVNVRARRDESGNRRVVSVPDHVEILCEMTSGAVMHMRFSDVIGLAPSDQIWLYGERATLQLDIDTALEDSDNARLYGGRVGDEKLAEIEIPAEMQGRWRVEEEFINAVRGIGPVTYTTFEDGVRYMEFTEAVTRSAQSHETVYLPL
jgi:predicted dehydrogenase